MFDHRLYLDGGLDLPGADVTVVVTGVKDGTIGSPSEASAVWAAAGLTLAEWLEGWLDGVDEALSLDVPDGDALIGGGADPGLGWAGGDGVDWSWGGEGEGAGTGLGEPHYDLAVGATRNDPLAVWSEGNAGAAALVSLDGVGELALVTDGPDLDGTIPVADSDNEWLVLVFHWGAGNRGSPGIAWKSGLALAKDVPDADGVVAGNGDDAAVVWGEGDVEDILIVAKEELLGGALGEVPKAEGAVPGGGKKVGSIAGKGCARDEVVVALKAGELLSPNLLGTWELPNESGLVAGSGDENAVLGVNLDSLDGGVVALENGAWDEVGGFLFLGLDDFLNLFDLFSGHVQKGRP